MSFRPLLVAFLMLGSTVAFGQSEPVPDPYPDTGVEGDAGLDICAEQLRSLNELEELMWAQYERIDSIQEHLDHLNWLRDLYLEALASGNVPPNHVPILQARVNELDEQIAALTEELAEVNALLQSLQAQWLLIWSQYSEDCLGVEGF